MLEILRNLQQKRPNQFSPGRRQPHDPKAAGFGASPGLLRPGGWA